MAIENLYMMPDSHDIIPILACQRLFRFVKNMFLMT